MLAYCIHYTSIHYTNIHYTSIYYRRDSMDYKAIEKETYIVWIDMMIGLTEKEKQRLYEMDDRKVEFRYKMALTEKTDEMIG